MPGLPKGIWDEGKFTRLRVIVQDKVPLVSAGCKQARGDELGAHDYRGQEPRAAGTISTADPKTGDPTIQSYLAIQPGWRSSEREALRSARRPAHGPQQELSRPEP
eukprot:1189638-Prorocentrum_minimum.AAC.2